MPIVKNGQTISLGYEHKQHKLTAAIDNAFDKRYAVEVSKDSRGNKSYAAGAPRTVFVNYTYQF